MKVQFLLFIVYLGASLAANGQARIVLNNFGPGVCTQVFDVGQVTPLEGERYQAQLWYREVGTQGPLIPHSETVGFFTGIGAGFMDGKDLVLPDITPFRTILAQVRVWDTETGVPWESARTRFQSNTIRAITGSGTSPAVFLVGLEFTSLRIHHSENGFVLTWPNQQACEKTYQLESTEDVSEPWSAVEEPAELVEGRWQVTLENPNAFARYFRLRLIESDPDPQMLIALMEQLGMIWESEQRSFYRAPAEPQPEPRDVLTRD